MPAQPPPMVPQGMVAQGTRSLPSRVLAIGTGLVALYILLLTGQRSLDAARAQDEVRSVAAEVAMLKAQNAELLAELASDRQDEEIERIAREQLGLVRPGDQAVVLLWPSPPRPSESTTPVAQGTEPNWMAWVRHFVDLDTPRGR